MFDVACELFFYKYTKGWYGCVCLDNCTWDGARGHVCGFIDRKTINEKNINLLLVWQEWGLFKSVGLQVCRSI